MLVVNQRSGFGPGVPIANNAYLLKSNKQANFNGNYTDTLDYGNAIQYDGRRMFVIVSHMRDNDDGSFISSIVLSGVSPSISLTKHIETSRSNGNNRTHLQIYSGIVPVNGYTTLTINSIPNPSDVLYNAILAYGLKNSSPSASGLATAASSSASVSVTNPANGLVLAASSTYFLTGPGPDSWNNGTEIYDDNVAEGGLSTVLDYPEAVKSGVTYTANGSASARCIGYVSWI